METKTNRSNQKGNIYGTCAGTKLVAFGVANGIKYECMAERKYLKGYTRFRTRDEVTKFVENKRKDVKYPKHTLEEEVSFMLEKNPSEWIADGIQFRASCLTCQHVIPLLLDPETVKAGVVARHENDLYPLRHKYAKIFINIKQEIEKIKSKHNTDYTEKDIKPLTEKINQLKDALKLIDIKTGEPPARPSKFEKDKAEETELKKYLLNTPTQTIVIDPTLTGKPKKDAQKNAYETHKKAVNLYKSDWSRVWKQMWGDYLKSLEDKWKLKWKDELEQRSVLSDKLKTSEEELKAANVYLELKTNLDLIPIKKLEWSSADEAIKWIELTENWADRSDIDELGRSV